MQLGLSSFESKVYRALIKSGPALVSAIALTSRLHRPQVYAALGSLEQRGLVSRFPFRRRTQFVAESPIKINETLDQLHQETKREVAQLLTVYRQARKVPVVKFLSGIRGIRLFFSDMVESLQTGEVFFRISSRDPSTTDSRLFIPPRYRVMRDKKSLQRFVITSEKLGRIKRPNLNKLQKLIPTKEDPFVYNVAQFVYDNKAAFVDYNSQTVTIIENRHIADFCRSVFRRLFDRLEP